MDNEVYKVLSHHEARDQLAEQFSTRGGIVKVELRLPSGKIADVAWCDEFEDIMIFEVKTAYKASLVQDAYNKYWRWSNYTWVAIPDLTAQAWPMLKLAHMASPAISRVGVMGVYPYSNAVYHPPAQHALIGENRLQMLELFAK